VSPGLQEAIIEDAESDNSSVNLQSDSEEDNF